MRIILSFDALFFAGWRFRHCFGDGKPRKGPQIIFSPKFFKPIEHSSSELLHKIIRKKAASKQIAKAFSFNRRAPACFFALYEAVHTWTKVINFI